MTQKITLIIPLRLTAGTYEGEMRLRRLCATVPRDIYDILISDYGTEDRFRGPIRAMAEAGVEVVRHPAPGKLFSIGHARDFGVQMARQKVVLFNDIDFLGTEDMYRRIHAEVESRDIASNLFDFFCVPVLFLSEEGTRDWFRLKETGAPFIERFDIDGLDAAADRVQFTAFGSSAMVVNRHHYLSLGGHDPHFTGHGAEDYDLLHRLATLAPKGPRPNDYFTDFRDNGVRNYWGFRPWYALYGLDVFQRQLHLVHLWHPRREEKGYFRPRANFRRLRRVMRGFERRGRMPMPLPDLIRKENWLVFYRSQRDLMLLRQILPFAGKYRMIASRSLPSGYRLSRILDMDEDHIVVIAPDVRGERADFAGDPALAGLPVLSLEASGAPGAHRLLRLNGEPSHTTEGTVLAVRTRPHRAAFLFWTELDLPGAFTLRTGRIPVPEPLTSAIFASFGGPDLLDKRLHPRPLKKRKSPLWLRLKRRLTGY